jgi:hypothetical protein
MDSNVAFTPGGPRLRSKVHLVAPDTTVTVVKSVETSLKKNKQAGRPDQANWITAAWLDMTGTSVKSFVASWKVPSAPTTQSSQLLYLFNGMEPADSSTIIQPVLQWGDSGPDKDGINRTGKFWTVASWIVPAPDGCTYHTPHVRVNPGDTLVGSMTLIAKSAAGCTYACEFVGLAGTRFLTPAISELVWCVQTLEAYELSGNPTPPYDLNSASEYPAAKFTEFKSIKVATDGAPSGAPWTVCNYESKFGEHTQIVVNSPGNGDIQIHYSADGTTAGPSV